MSKKTMRDFDSVWRGILAMKRPFVSPPPRWRILGMKAHGPGRFWFHAWTPIWHEGRGPYISIGLGLFGVYRGY